MKYQPRMKSDYALSPPTEKPVSLTPVPFEIPPANADETKPTTPPIRGEITPIDKRWLRGMARTR